MKAIFVALSKILPYWLIPKLTGNRDGIVYSYSESENRARWAESNYNLLAHKLQKYSPHKKWLEFRREKVLIQLFQLIGEITLRHAYCEQELKGFLLQISGRPPHEKCHGGQLRAEAEKIVSKIPFNQFRKEFNDWLAELAALSYKRDRAVKTIYVTHADSLEFSKINPIKLGSSDWITPVQLEELHKLRSDLKDCFLGLLELRAKLFHLNFKNRPKTTKA